MSEGGSTSRVWFWGTRLTVLAMFLVAVGVVVWVRRNLDVPPVEVVSSSPGSLVDPAERTRILEESIAAEPVDLKILVERFEEKLSEGAAEVEAYWQERKRVPVEERCRIDAGPDARIHAMFKEERLQYRMEEVAHYQKKTQDRGEGRRHGAEFLTAYMRFAANMDEADDKVALREKAEKALAAGASDPMVRLYYARILSHFDEMDEAMRIIKEVVKPIEDGSYRAITTYLVRSWLLVLPHKDRPNGQMHVDSSVVEAAIDYLEAEADRDNQRIVYKPVSGLFTGGDDRVKAALFEAILASEATDLWIRHMIAGRYYVSLACGSRGQSWAREVSPEGWEGFYQNLPSSGAHLRRAWQLHPEYPEAAICLIDVAKLDGGDGWSSRDWFYEAARAEMDHYGMHATLRGAILPRWGGSYEAMLAHATECLDTGRWDTKVPLQVVETLFTIQQEFPAPGDFVQVPGVASLSKRYAEELLAASGADSNIPGNALRSWAYLAATLVRAGEYALARRIFEERGDGMEQCDMSYIEAKLTTVRGRAYANTGPARESVEYLEDAFADGAFGDGEAEVFEELRSRLEEVRQVEESPEVGPYFEDLATMIDQLERFFAGETVELTPDETATGWYARARLRSEPDGWTSVEGFSSAHGAQLRLLAPFPSPFALEVEFRLGHVGVHANTCGIMLGPSDYRAVYHMSWMRHLLVHSCGEYIPTRVGDGEGAKDSHRCEKDSDHRLEVRVWPGRVQMYRNETLLRDDGSLPEDLPANITLGEMLPARHPITFWCRNIRIRRLLDEPPPAADGEAETVVSLSSVP
jgi:tetratricopeptide (TPR) repeat protein